MHIEEKKLRLFGMLYKDSFKYVQEGEEEFKLSSGKTSRFYLDTKQVTMTFTGSVLVGEIICEMIGDMAPILRIDGVGGLTLGADPIAYAVMATSGIKTFVIRKRAKEHGTEKLIEGPVQLGERVIILEDVVTSGRSVVVAITEARKAGLQVKGVIALIDREEGGRELIKQYAPAYRSVFTKEDFIPLKGPLKGNPISTSSYT